MWPKKFLSLILLTSKQIQTESIFYKEGTCIAEYTLNNTSTENITLETFLTLHQYLGACDLFVIDIFYAQNLCHAELWVIGGITPHNFNLGTRERWVASFLSWYPGERASCTCRTEGWVVPIWGLDSVENTKSLA